MEHIPTTATAVQNLKRAAKKRRKCTGESLAAAQDALAREAGYANWKHVTVCQAATGVASAAKPVLPAGVQAFLSAQRAKRPAPPEVLEAMRGGLLFAMDVKDADSVNPESREGIEECEEARPYLAGDVWQALIAHDKEEGSVESRRLQSDPGEVFQSFFDDMANYRFFLYRGHSTPKTLEDAFATVFNKFFFPPTHVWLAGKFVDIADVREVRVEGRAVYSTSPGGPASDAPAFEGQPPQPANAPSAVGASPGRPLIAKLDVRKWEPGMYEYIVHESGHELYTDAGFNSISEALKSASDTEGDIVGFEVSYAGYVVGTYPVAELHATAEAVAQRAVDTASSMRWAE